MILCVLRSGGDYGPEHVARLYAQVTRHAPKEEFICLTDMPDVMALGCRVRGLQHRWPGFWSKLEVFALPGPVLYLDLDCTVVGDLQPLLDAAEENDFVICRDFQSPDIHVINSSVMAWPRRTDVQWLYYTFSTSPANNMAPYVDPRRWREPGRGWGDQGWIRDHWHGRTAFWQDVCPGMVMGYKTEILRGVATTDMRVCVHTGRPRPWEVGR